MARKRKYRQEADKDPELDISSLVDVAFLLLIYFLVTSTLRPDETDLSIVLPTQIPTENPDPVDPVAIVIGPSGLVTYDGEDIPTSGAKGADRLPKLRNLLKEYKLLADSSGSKPMVIVAADDEGKTQRFIDVVNALASAKIKNITMTGFRDEEE
ncbi:MAG: biopolymer transporter ExbD [Verrucomicrobiota bacterium]|nr:biopolymer transporter ExbD [Verrucomicrobiota bacterium]